MLFSCQEFCGGNQNFFITYHVWVNLGKSLGSGILACACLEQVGSFADVAAAPLTRALTRAGAETSTRPSKETARKIKPKARRSGAVPAEPLRTGFRFFRRAWLSSFDFSRPVHLLNFASFGWLRLA